MKAKIATAVSLTGVLMAGSAAALVNTQILDGGTPAGATSQAVLPPPATVTVTIPPTSSTTTTAPSTSTTSVPAASTTTAAPAPPLVPAAAPADPSITGMLTAFTVGDAGVVTVDVVSGRVVFVGAEPADGWTVIEAEQGDDSPDDDDDNGVEVKFASGTTIVEFEVNLVGGQLVPRVESKSVANGQASSGTGGPVTTLFDDDDHGDDDHDDDHDDDDHDDDDDDHDDDSGRGGDDDHDDDDDD